MIFETMNKVINVKIITTQQRFKFMRFIRNLRRESNDLIND